MGTRSDIIVHCANNQWARIYCHWDSNIEYNGKILQQHYTTQEKCDALVALGDISSLGEEIGEKHDWERCSAETKYDDELLTPEWKVETERFQKMCFAYGRDCGETGVGPKVGDSLSAVWPGDDTGTEFTYVFGDPGDGKGKRWFVRVADEGQQTLRDLGAVIREDEAPKTAITAFGGNFVIGPMLKMNFRDVAQANIDRFDQLGAFHGESTCQYHYSSGLGCAIGIMDDPEDPQLRVDANVYVYLAFGNIGTDGIDVLSFIQDLHDFRATCTDWSAWDWTHAPSPKIQELVEGLEGPEDLTPELYKLIMQMIVDLPVD